MSSTEAVFSGFVCQHFWSYFIYKVLISFLSFKKKRPKQIFWFFFTLVYNYFSPSTISIISFFVFQLYSYWAKETNIHSSCCNLFLINPLRDLTLTFWADFFHSPVLLPDCLPLSPVLSSKHMLKHSLPHIFISTVMPCFPPSHQLITSIYGTVPDRNTVLHPLFSMQHLQLSCRLLVAVDKHRIWFLDCDKPKTRTSVCVHKQQHTLCVVRGVFRCIWLTLRGAELAVFTKLKTLLNAQI